MASPNSSQEAKHTTPWFELGHRPAAAHPVEAMMTGKAANCQKVAAYLQHTGE